MGNMLASQKVLFNDCRDLSQFLHRIYQSNNQDSTWPPAAYQLQFSEVANSYKQSWDLIHDLYRSSAAKICVEETIDPIKEASSEYSRTVDAEIKSRKIRLTDYDSYRRRLRGLEQKRDANEVSKSIFYLVN
jgi:hypothetical protein